MASPCALPTETIERAWTAREPLAGEVDPRVDPDGRLGPSFVLTAT